MKISNVKRIVQKQRMRHQSIHPIVNEHGRCNKPNDRMKNITPDFAKCFAEEWISSWNSHEINKILSYYSDDFVIESRMAFKLVPGSNGTVVGKKAVKEYWIIGLNRNKNLEFKKLFKLVI